MRVDQFIDIEELFLLALPTATKLVMLHSDIQRNLFLQTQNNRLEFLGDSVLDYLITMHLYHKYPGMSPGLLTDLRSTSVNNDCYAQSTVKVGLHKHVLHASPELYKHISVTVNNFEKLSLESTFGWESETSFPKVLGDVIESLAGEILVDSGYNKEIVFESIRSNQSGHVFSNGGSRMKSSIKSDKRSPPAKESGEGEMKR